MTTTKLAAPSLQGNFRTTSGIRYGIENIPIEWIERVEGMEQIIENSLKCFANQKD